MNRKLLLGLIFVALAGSIALGGWYAHTTTTATQPDDQEPLRLALHSGSATGSCGVELWSIKTLTDSAASQVDLTPKPTTIATLEQTTPPTFNYNRSRFAPVETTTWQLTATLTGFKLEADSDYHLVLSDGQGHSMIAEIPDPTCASGSRVLSQITAARAAFEKDHNVANECFGCLNETVTLQGVGFFDALHGQTGVAPNGVELHPVISYVPGGSPPPPVTTPTTTSTTTQTTTSVPTTTIVPTTTTTQTKDDALDERAGCVKYPGKIYFNHKKQTHCAANFFTTP